MTVVRLVGDRMSGKSEALCSIAARALVDGQRVLWVSESRDGDYCAYARMNDYLEYYHPEIIEKSWRTNGQQRIRCTGGGMIYFGPQRVTPDVVISDGVYSDPEWTYPNARVYKAMT